MAYNVTGIKTINELNTNSSINSNTNFVIGNGINLQKCQYDQLSNKLNQDLDIDNKIENNINILSTSLSTTIDKNFIKDDLLKNNYYNKTDIDDKITTINSDINSKTIPVASTNTIGGFILTDSNTELEIKSENDSHSAKYPIKLFNSSEKNLSNVAYVEIDNTIVNDTNISVRNISYYLQTLSDRVDEITESTSIVTFETIRTLSNDINAVSSDLIDTNDNINSLITELYGEEFNRQSFLSVNVVSNDLIRELSNTYNLCAGNITDGITLKYDGSFWNLIIDNDDSSLISVISSNVHLSTFGLSVINVNNTEITSFLLNDIIDIELHKDKQTGNYITYYIDYTFTNGEKTGGDIGTLLNSITNDWHDISSASETDKKIPTAYAIKEYINQVLKSTV